MFGGIATGKTYLGSHFVIDHVERFPEFTGLIGANTYDQLSQATMRELIFWLEEYRYDYVIDQRPPLSWGGRREFKTYKNVLTIRPKSKKNCHTSIFTRVMSEGNPLRGTQFAWYWLDETRDTPQATHDVVLSRMRQSKTYRRGLITSTTNGEDWAYERFVKNCRKGQRLYGSMHIPTISSVHAGIISQGFFDTLKQSYSEMMALQELDALHVNVLTGRAYYAAGKHNQMRIAPWGDQYPSRDRPLVIGCDFNFSPAPMVWMVGQMGPNEEGPKGQEWWKHIHWFKELSGVEYSSPQMAIRLLGEFPEYFYEIYGDMSGARGTTSNAGLTDFHQIGNVLTEAGALYSISVEQMDPKEAKINPRVRSRVENMNRTFRNAVGEILQTYNPDTCPLFDLDTRMVGWKKSIENGRGKLDDSGDTKRTHASDGAGYAVFKKLPPGQQTTIIDSNRSMILSDVRGALSGQDIYANN